MLATIKDKKINNNKKYVIGLDFGTDSARALVVNVDTGKEESTHVSYYKRWGQGSYQDASKNIFRHHPLDYMESLQEVINTSLEKMSEGSGNNVIAIGAIEKDYEEETGTLIVDTFNTSKLDYMQIKVCLVAGHGPFTWGSSADDAVYMSKILEEIARQNFLTRSLNPDIEPLKKTMHNKYYFRKHGKDAYYGQDHQD